MKKVLSAGRRKGQKRSRMKVVTTHHKRRILLGIQIFMRHLGCYDFHRLLGSYTSNINCWGNCLYASPCGHGCERSRMRQVRIVPVVGGVINRDLSATIAESRKMALQIFVFIYRPELAELTRDFLLLHCCNGSH